MDDEEFKSIYDTCYKSRSPPKKEKCEEDKTEGKSKEESSDGPEEDDVPGVPVSFQSRQSKLQDAKERSKELKWKRKREDELLCKVCGEYGHYSQGCPTTLKPRKAPELQKRSLMDKIILSDSRLPSRIIGTGGAIVKGIEKETNCRIQIETPKSPSDEPLHVRISGDDPAELESAKQAVLKIIDDWTHQRGHEHSSTAHKFPCMSQNDYLPQMEQPLTSRYDQRPGYPSPGYPNLPQQQPQQQQQLQGFVFSANSGGGESNMLQPEQQPLLQPVLPSEVIAIQRRYSSMEADEIERHRTAMQKLREDQQKELEDIRGRAANKRAHQSHEFLQSLLVSMQQALYQCSGTNESSPIPVLSNGALESFMAQLSHYVGSSNPNVNTVDPNSSSRQPYPSLFSTYPLCSQFAAPSGYASSNFNQSQRQDASMASAYGPSSAGQSPLGSKPTPGPISSNGSMIKSEQYQSSTINSNQYPCYPSSVNANLMSSISLMMPQYPGAIDSGQSQYAEHHLSSQSHQQKQHSSESQQLHPSAGAIKSSQSQQTHPFAVAINSGQSQQSQPAAGAINTGQSQTPSSHQQFGSLLHAFLHSQFR